MPVSLCFNRRIESRSSGSKVAESFKFVRVFPLTQADVQSEPKSSKETTTGALRVIESVMDYTPPGLISLLFTDIGQTLAFCLFFFNTAQVC